MRFSHHAHVWALALFCILTLAADPALAQRRAPHPRTTAPATGGIEFSTTYGTMWGGNVNMRLGKLRAGTGPSWGFALDIPAAYGAAVELSYTRQSGSLDYDKWGVTTLTDMTVNHWQIGGLRSLHDGPVSPFLVGGLGATHFSPSDGSVLIEDTEYSLQSFTRFSLHFGAGFKAYFGQARKIGLRASFKFMPTLYDTGAGLWFGSGGASVSVSGYAIWQYEAAAGLTVRFGG